MADSEAPGVPQPRPSLDDIRAILREYLPPEPAMEKLRPRAAIGGALLYLCDRIDEIEREMGNRTDVLLEGVKVVKLEVRELQEGMLRLLGESTAPSTTATSGAKDETPGGGPRDKTPFPAHLASQGPPAGQAANPVAPNGGKTGPLPDEDEAPKPTPPANPAKVKSASNSEAPANGAKT